MKYYPIYLINNPTKFLGIAQVSDTVELPYTLSPVFAIDPDTGEKVIIRFDLIPFVGDGYVGE